MSITETALAFFSACDGGKGWDACKEWCHEDATFSCQADALADVNTLAAYVEWEKGLFTPIPDITAEIKSVGLDQERNSVSIFAVVTGTQTGEGGPVPPTNNKVVADYVYSIEFDGDKISNMVKIWNDVYTLKQLGWM
jgi:hypothetical protein